MNSSTRTRSVTRKVRQTKFRLITNSQTNKQTSKQTKPTKQPTNQANKQTNEHESSLFLQMARSSKANAILACGAGGQKPYEKYLEEFGWTLGFNDAENLCRLRQEGSIQQIAGRREDDPSTRESLMQSLRSRWGKAISRVCCIPARGTFLSKSHRTWRRYDTCKDGYNQNSCLSC